MRYGIGKSIPPNQTSQGTQLSIDRNNGTVQIQLTLPGIQAPRLLLIPYPTSDKKLVWKCRSEDVPIEYLPAGCGLNPDSRNTMP